MLRIEQLDFQKRNKKHQGAVPVMFLNMVDNIGEDIESLDLIDDINIKIRINKN